MVHGLIKREVLYNKVSTLFFFINFSMCAALASDTRLLMLENFNYHAAGRKSNSIYVSQALCQRYDN